MSQPAIPNLNSLRRGRGRGRGRFGEDVASPVRPNEDAIVRGTDDDAATSRMSAVNAGYLDDPFAEHLTGDQWQRRLPLMNRGTYVRTSAIDRVVHFFLQTVTEKKQIISLGAGSDTRNFRLRATNQDYDFVYHEVDFPENNERKLQRLFTPSCLQLVRDRCQRDLLKGQRSRDSFTSADYFVHSLDLRQLDQNYILSTFDVSMPTLIISECCLVYLLPEAADRVLDLFVSTFSSSLMVVVYEPIHPHTAFGKVMTRNLVSRGIRLQTVEKYADLSAQAQRLQQRDLHAQVFDIHSIWQNWISVDEKARVERLEWMDEVEEFVLLSKHYCLAVGSRDMPAFDPDTRPASTTQAGL